MPLAGPSTSLVKDLGVYGGKKVPRWMRELLERKGVRTFKQLIGRETDDLRYRYGARVIASDITERRMLVLPRDAAALGYENPDDFDVALTVRMSIPIFFEPVGSTLPRTGREHVVVDGGMLYNFTIWSFDAGESPWPTYGLRPIEPDPRAPLDHGISRTSPRHKARPS